MITRRTALALLAATPWLPGAAQAHNNPSFEKAVIAEIEVKPEAAADGANSASFDLELPPKTIQLYYEVVSDEQAAIRFAIASGAEQVAADLQHEGKSSPIKTGPLTIVNVSGATKPFTVRIIAEHIVKPSG